MNDINTILAAQNGGKDALEKLVTENTPLVWSIVRRFCGRGCEAEDLFQIGCIGLIKAIRRFDTGYDVRFSTYAVPLIMGEIKRFLRDDGIIKVSRRYKELSACASAARAKLASRLNREPTVSEIAAEVGADAEELSCALEACSPCDSIYKTASDGEKKEMYLLDKLACGDDGKTLEKLDLSLAVENLTERERLIVKMRFFMDKTQCQVAKRLGISQVQVSRIEKKLLMRLRERCG